MKTKSSISWGALSALIGTGLIGLPTPAYSKKSGRELSPLSLVNKSYTLLTGESLRKDLTVFGSFGSNLRAHETRILSQEAIFLRCYRALANRTPVRASVPYQRVLNGEPALKVCEDLVDDISLDNNGYFESQDPSRTPVSTVSEIAEGLYRTHNQMIPSIPRSVPELRNRIMNILSEQPAADYLTYILMKDLPFSTLVTTDKIFLPLYERRGDPNDNSKSNYGPRAHDYQCPNYSIYGPNVMHVVREEMMSEGGARRNTGDLKGFFEETFDREYPACRDAGKEDYIARPHKSNGAGVLGSAGYILAHANYRSTKRADEASDGGMKVHRRWAQRALEHFFCRSLPVVRMSDAQAFAGLPSSTGDHAPTFRIASTCMQCHSTIDSMAFALRHQVPGDGMEGEGGNQHWIMVDTFRGTLKESLFKGAAQTNAADFARAMPKSDVDFAKRPAEGALYYRNFRGRLNFIGPDKINSLAALGREISQTEDFYACGASRYVNLLTPYSIALTDGGPANGDADEVYKWFADTLVPRFQEHKSVKKLIKEIMQSKYFLVK